jgi:hypothetical protein
VYIPVAAHTQATYPSRNPISQLQANRELRYSYREAVGEVCLYQHGRIVDILLRRLSQGIDNIHWLFAGAVRKCLIDIFQIQARRSIYCSAIRVSLPRPGPAHSPDTNVEPEHGNSRWQNPCCACYGKAWRLAAAVLKNTAQESPCLAAAMAALQWAASNRRFWDEHLCSPAA